MTVCTQCCCPSHASKEYRVQTKTKECVVTPGCGPDHARKKPKGLIAYLVAQGGHEHIVGVEAWRRGLTCKVGVRAHQALHALTAQRNRRGLDVDANCAAAAPHLQMMHTY